MRMPKCSVCGSTVELSDGVTLLNEEHRRRAKGDFACWTCWYAYLVEGEVIEDETSKTIETPQLKALRKAKERRRL